MQVEPPTRVHDERTNSWLSAHPAGNDLITYPERAGFAAPVTRPLPLGKQRPVRDPHRGQVELGAKMQRKPCPARMIPPGGVDH